MGELYKIVQGHLDRYGVREAEFARRLGSSPQTVNNWKNRGVRKLPYRRARSHNRWQAAEVRICAGGRTALLAQMATADSKTA